LADEAGVCSQGGERRSAVADVNVADERGAGMYRRVRSAGWRLLGLPVDLPPEGSRRLIPPELVREALRAHGRFRMVALGASMAPAIIHGQELVFEPVALEDVRNGDVLLAYYASQRRFCVHRAVRRVGGALLTKGDSLDVLDEPVRSEELLGRLRLLQRGDGVMDVTRPRLRLAAAFLARLSLLSVVVASAVCSGSGSAPLARLLRVPGFVLAYLVFRLPSRLS
jgi:hypothetical protein